MWGRMTSSFTYIRLPTLVVLSGLVWFGLGVAWLGAVLAGAGWLCCREEGTSGGSMPLQAACASNCPPTHQPKHTHHPSQAPAACPACTART